MSHAGRGYQPSSMKRTLHCSGWVQESKGAPDPPESDYAREGSCLHYLSEECLNKERDPFQYVGKEISYHKGKCLWGKLSDASYLLSIDESAAAAVKVYVDYVQEIKRQCKYWQVEAKLKLDWLAPGVKGTADFFGVIPGSKQFLIDAKYGRGVIVEVGVNVGDNEQLSTYALMGLGKENLHKVPIIDATIVQPRAPHPDGSIRTVEYKTKDLYEWGNDVLKPAIDRLDSLDTTLVTGSWCSWCPANQINKETGVLYCRAKREEAMSDLATIFPADVALAQPVATAVDPKSLTGEQLGKMLKMEKTIAEIFDRLKEEARYRIDHKTLDAPADWKLVDGQLSRRAFEAVQPVVDKLSFILGEDSLYQERKLKTPAQIEAALKQVMAPKDAAELINSLIAPRTKGAPSLVLAEDPRDEFSSIDEAFGGD